jgi:hypothetical protein
MTSEDNRIARLIYPLAGLLIWGAHLTLIYAFTALACARRFAGIDILGVGVVPLAVGLATLLALAALAAVLRRALGRRSSAHGTAPDNAFIDYVTAAAAILALFGVLWQALPILLIPPCA